MVIGTPWLTRTGGRIFNNTAKIQEIEPDGGSVNKKRFLPTQRSTGNGEENGLKYDDNRCNPTRDNRQGPGSGRVNIFAEEGQSGCPQRPEWQPAPSSAKSLMIATATSRCQLRSPRWFVPPFSSAASPRDRVRSTAHHAPQSRPVSGLQNGPGRRLAF